MKYKAICGNSSITIRGCATIEEALEFAVKCFSDNCDLMTDVDLYSSDGEYLMTEEI